MFRHQTVNDINSLQRMSQVTKSNAVEFIRAVIQVLSYRLKELREAHLAKEMALTKFKKMAGEDWRKSKLLHVISALETYRFDIECCISDIVELVTKLGSVLSSLCEAKKLYITGKQVYLDTKANYIHYIKVSIYCSFGD